MVPAYELPKVSITLVAAADMSKKRYTFGTVNTDGALVTPAAGKGAVGVIQTPGIVSEPCNVMTTGVSFITMGGVLTPGDMISVGADGKGVKATAATESVPGTEVIGMCLVGGAADEIGSILLK